MAPFPEIGSGRPLHVLFDVVSVQSTDENEDDGPVIEIKKCTETMKVEQISDHAYFLGEGPHWDDRVQALYFVDIFEKNIHKYDPATKKVSTAKLGFIVPLESHTDQFVMWLEREFVVVQWDGTDGGPARVVRSLAEVDMEVWQKTNRINDGKADPRGRIYAGTMGLEDEQFNLTKDVGTLYRLESSGVTALANHISISNGLCWDLNAKAMYSVDSPEGKIRRYDYDVETGDISNLKYIFDLDKNNVKGSPDGCTIDTDGNLWVAVFGGGCVLQVSPEGKLLRQVPVPAKQVTSCTFGGANLDVLFVTTARLNIEGDETHPSGCTFQISGLGVRGHPNVNCKL